MNITWQSFVLHLFNIVVLYLLVWFLLYKPISNYMKKRKEGYQNERDAIKGREDGVARREEESDIFLRNARDKGRKIADQEIEAVKQKAKTILDNAQQEAEQLISHARNEMEEERTVMREELRKDAVEMAVRIAEKIIVKNFDDEDNKAFIDKCLKEELSGE